MAIQKSRLGDSGLNELADNNNRSVEHLVELQGREGSVRYRQMSRGDGYVGMALLAIKNPIRSASWNIPYPPEATDEEIKAVDLIKGRLFGESGCDFESLLGQILSLVEYGFSIFERYYEPLEVDGTTYMMPVIQQRIQTSIQDILPQDNKIRQVTIEKGLVEIAFENLVFFVINKQGQDMRGESMLRNAYRAWKDKNIYREWLGIGIQRSASGIPSMEVPKGTDINGAKYAAVEQLLQNITMHENAYMITEEGYKFNIFESKFNSEQVMKAIDACNSEMAVSVLVQFILLGQTGSGSYALSRDQSDFFLDGLQYIVNLISGSINKNIIDPFIKINFGDKIDASRIGIYAMNINKKAGLELSQVLGNLRTAGFIKPTVSDEIQLRSNLEMPELTVDEIAKREEKVEEPAPKVPAIVKLSEKKDRKDRQEYIQNSEKEMLDFMQANLLLIKDKLLADIDATLNRGTIEIQGLKNIEISSAKYLKGLQMKLSGIAMDSWNNAKSKAKEKAIKLSDIEPKKIVDKTLQQFVLNQAQSITDKQSAGMLNRAILTASNNSLKGLSISQTVSNVSRAIDDFINSSGVQVDGSLIVVGTANFGEAQFYKEIEDQLWGFRFVNSDPISEICQWYNGKTFSVNSPELITATAPLHPNCKSYMEPIYKSEMQPEIDNVIAPPSIMKGKTFY